MKIKKRKKKRYKTGTHVSAKCDEPVNYRSGWEKLVCLYFDDDNNVLEYFYEKIKILYIANIKTGKIRTYYPDFFVVYKDGTKKIIEVKRKNQLDNIKVVKKAKAAEEWCKKHQIIYEFLTDEKIKELQKLYKQTLPNQKRKKQVKKKLK